jgi:pantoate--beta-alanine ligase
MDVIAGIPEFREVLSRRRRGGAAVVLVPTMGALHDGHRACVELARRAPEASGVLVVVSIFVNPTQFSPGEDLSRYPRPLELDLERCRAWGCDVAFTPDDRALYPAPQRVWVEVEGLTGVLCGETRPGHFRGVATVVSKLFHIVEPDIAIFGQKDAQQALVIREMVRQLDMGVELRLASTVRESDGLAMSSRNAYLDAGARRRATAISGALVRAGERIRAGERDPRRIESQALEDLGAGGVGDVEYVRVLAAADLSPLDAIEGRVILAIAARVGGARLIDNMVYGVDGNHVSVDVALF